MFLPLANEASMHGTLKKQLIGRIGRYSTEVMGGNTLIPLAHARETFT